VVVPELAIGSDHVYNNKKGRTMSDLFVI